MNMFNKLEYKQLNKVTSGDSLQSNNMKLDAGYTQCPVLIYSH